MGKPSHRFPGLSSRELQIKTLVNQRYVRQCRRSGGFAGRAHTLLPGSGCTCPSICAFTATPGLPTACRLRCQGFPGHIGSTGLISSPSLRLTRLGNGFRPRRFREVREVDTAPFITDGDDALDIAGFDAANTSAVSRGKHGMPRWRCADCVRIRLPAGRSRVGRSRN
jgi:hypothetical protein